MEEVIEYLKQYFEKHNCTNRDGKLAFTIGYLEDHEKINRKEAMQIVWKVFSNKI